jgi:Fe-S-cluster-containing hydrogenase component 2
MNRFTTARAIFDRQSFFKLVCGAGNEDPVEVRRLAMVYTLAGASGIDLSANPAIIQSAVEGISRALVLAPELGKILKYRPFITVSVGLEGDPHIRKAGINPDSCIRCDLCISVCEQEAIDSSYRILQKRCIGCGRCADACTSGAVFFVTEKRDLASLLPKCLAAGAEMVELHAVTDDDTAVFNDWKTIAALVPDNFISMCLDRSVLSNNHLQERVKMAYGIAGDRLIIQADGAPMSGGKDDYNTTLQAIATADIIKKTGIPVKILASGGTNAKTMELADLCGVPVNGVSIGTYARKIIRHYLEKTDFDTDIPAITSAVKIARELVRTNTRHMQ